MRMGAFSRKLLRKLAMESKGILRATRCWFCGITGAPIMGNKNFSRVFLFRILEARSKNTVHPVDVCRLTRAVQYNAQCLSLLIASLNHRRNPIDRVSHDESGPYNKVDSCGTARSYVADIIKKRDQH